MTCQSYEYDFFLVDKNTSYQVWFSKGLDFPASTVEKSCSTMQSNLAFAALSTVLSYFHSKASLRMSGSFLLRAPVPTWLRGRTPVRLLWKASSGGKPPLFMCELCYGSPPATSHPLAKASHELYHQLLLHLFEYGQ